MVGVTGAGSKLPGPVESVMCDGDDLGESSNAERVKLYFFATPSMTFRTCACVSAILDMLSSAPL